MYICQLVLWYDRLKLFLILVLMWFFYIGLSRFKTDIRAMVVSHHKIHDGFMILWEISWTLFTPGILTVSINFLAD